MKPDFDNINMEILGGIVKSGTLENLPVEYQEYYSLMDLVRGLRARGVFQGKVIQKAGIIKLLKSEYKLTDYQARRLYEDSINFFYSYENVNTEAYANLYAEKLENAAVLALETNQLDSYHRLIKEAATLRGCYKPKPDEIPEEFYRKPIIIYTTEIEDVGVSGEDLKELERIIDELPDIPVLKRDRLKAEAGVPGYKFEILRQIAEDYEEFSNDGEN